MKGLIFLVALTVAFDPGALAKTQSKTIRGYVTSLVSPTTFEIEDYRITRDRALRLEFEKGESEEDPTAFRPEDIRVGTELEIKGEYDEKTGELRANAIKVILEEHKRVKRTALIEHRPTLEKSAEGWVGSFFADGQRILVQPTTKVVITPNKSERKALKQPETAQRREAKGKEKPVKGKEKPVAGRAGDEEEEEGGEQYARPVRSLEELGPNTFMTYEGFRREDGSIEATRVEFMRNELDKWEADTRKKLTPQIKEANYAALKPGQLKVASEKYKLVPNREAQEYLQKLGQRLIPPYQASLPVDHPEKIPFRFFVVQAGVANAAAYPNGVVVVWSPMFQVLENEAQLAGVLGHEIAHAVQEHARRQREYHRKKLIALRIGAIAGGMFGGRAVTDIASMVEGAIRSGYSRSLENQADRVGLEYLVQAGFDAREAPRVWKVMAKNYGVQPTNFFWSSHDNAPTRRSYLMVELRNNYPNLDYGQLRKNEAEFDRIARLVVDATTKKKEKAKAKGKP